jgi:hypothetical protein
MTNWFYLTLITMIPCENLKRATTLGDVPFLLVRKSVPQNQSCYTFSAEARPFLRRWNISEVVRGTI